jgi:phosphoribosylformimino-5-aminoimidazole carboxamide ribotide isomerase
VILYPAIDIRDGKAVRLLQGDYDRETAYDDDPVEAALRWEGEGASWLHVVDLDGARAGEPVNLAHVHRIVAAVGIPVQLGGGLRDSKKVEQAISAGVERVVLGTAAVRDPDLAEAIAAAHGDRVVASVDARRGKVAAEGWTEESAAGPAEVIAALAERGIRRFVYTPVEVDGTMEGPDLDSVRQMAAASDADLISSGGVGTLDDLRALAALGLDNLDGVIVGKALYEGRFTVAEGRAALAG